MNNIVTEQTINSTTYRLTHYFDTINSYEIVKNASEKYWVNAPKTNSIENYDFSDEAKPWSLGPLLKNNGFEGGYTVLEVNNEPWSFGGIRKYDDNTSLVLARHFSFFTIKPITHGLLLPLHLKLSKELGYNKAWITINDYNLHWYRTWYLNEFNNTKRKHKRTNLLYLNSDTCVSSCKNLGKMTINNVEQTVLEWDL